MASERASSRTWRVASASQQSAMNSGLYEICASPGEMYFTTSSGCTIASDLNSSAGQTMRVSAL